MVASGTRPAKNKGDAVADDSNDKTRETVDRVLELAGELEAHGEVSLEGATLDRARAVLHRWIDSAVGVIALPAFGRVTLVHANGKQSSIASSELSYMMSEPESGATVR